MKYVDEYRSGKVAKSIAAAIAREAAYSREYHFMEFCGGHTHAISRYGLEDLLPANVRMIHGPGCPVCVTPIEMIDKAIAIAFTRILLRMSPIGKPLSTFPGHALTTKTKGEEKWRASSKARRHW